MGDSALARHYTDTLGAAGNLSRETSRLRFRHSLGGADRPRDVAGPRR